MLTEEVEELEGRCGLLMEEVEEVEVEVEEVEVVWESGEGFGTWFGWLIHRSRELVGANGVGYWDSSGRLPVCKVLAIN